MINQHNSLIQYVHVDSYLTGLRCMKRYSQRILTEVSNSISNDKDNLFHVAEAIKKFEKRNEFIINKYKELKFTRPEDAEMILEERKCNLIETLNRDL